MRRDGQVEGSEGKAREDSEKHTFAFLVELRVTLGMGGKRLVVLGGCRRRGRLAYLEGREKERGTNGRCFPSAGGGMSRACDGTTCEWKEVAERWGKRKGGRRKRKARRGERQQASTAVRGFSSSSHIVRSLLRWVSEQRTTQCDRANEEKEEKEKKRQRMGRRAGLKRRDLTRTTTDVPHVLLGSAKTT
jgi:hypothetical protein